MNEQGYAFRKDDAERIKKVIGPRANYLGRSTMFAVPTAQMAVAQTSSSISARSGTTLGSGTATLYDCTSGTLTATSISETVYNLSTKLIASSTYVMIQREYMTGLWLVVYEDC